MGFLDFLFGKPKTYSANNSLTLTTSQNRKSGVLGLKLNDVVGFDGVDYIVKHCYTYSESGFEWFSFHLVDSVTGSKIWLAVEDDDELEIGFFRPIELDLKNRVPSKISFDGDTYVQDEHGNANVFIQNELGEKFASVEYWEFWNDDDSSSLSVEKWGNELEVSIGKPIQEFELTILPGD